MSANVRVMGADEEEEELSVEATLQFEEMLSRPPRVVPGLLKAIGEYRAAMNEKAKEEVKRRVSDEDPPGGPLSEESAKSVLDGLDDVANGRVSPLDVDELEDE